MQFVRKGADANAPQFRGRPCATTLFRASRRGLNPSLPPKHIRKLTLSEEVGGNVCGALEAIRRNGEIMNMTLAVLMASE